MSSRRSLQLPIVLGVVMIVLLMVLTVGWVVLSVAGALADTRFAGFYWVVLSIGTTLLILLLVGVVVYLALSVKAINLTRRQSNFIDSVTHELKSPIASLKLYLQTLNRRQVTQQEQQDFFQFMLDDVERLDHLINHMLEAGQLEKGPIEADVEDVALAEVLAACANSVCLRYRVPRSVVCIEAAPCLVRAARVDLEMIFRNLIDNAVKYAGGEPEVLVTLETGPRGAVVTRIADNGPGIPKHQRRRIFGRFVRLGMELERKQTGTGLGLYIVRTLVRRLGGTIRVRDVDGGKGTLFEVELPGQPLPVEEAVDRSPAQAIEEAGV